jgi:hypothetical protein
MAGKRWLRRMLTAGPTMRAPPWCISRTERVPRNRHHPSLNGFADPVECTQGSHQDQPIDLVGRNRGSPVDFARCSLAPYMIGPPIPPAATVVLREARPSTSPGAAGVVQEADPLALSRTVSAAYRAKRSISRDVFGLHP